VNEIPSIAVGIPLSEPKRKLLGKLLRGEIAQNATDKRAITRRSPGTRVPLSLAQEQIWSVIESNPIAPPLYNESITIHKKGAMDVSTLERSFAEIIRRHEAWRTTFQVVDGRKSQIVQEASDQISLPFVDLRKLPKAEREREAARVATEEAKRPFDLRCGPLVRPTLVRLEDEEYRLFLTMHQLIVDGISVFRILPSELVMLYESFVVGGPSPLPELPVQFGDFACWQRQWFSDALLNKQLDYWRSHLSGHLPVLEWPKGTSRPAAQTLRGAIYPKLISRKVAEAIRVRSRGEGVTLFNTLLAGFATLLYSYTEQDDIIIGTLTPSGREHPEVQGLLGYFLNPLPLRFRLQDDPKFRDLLWQVREVTSAAVANDDVPFHYLAKELPEPDPSRNPFFQVVLSLAPELPELGAGWNQTFMDVESGGARWDLYLEFNDRPNGIIVRAQYNPDIFSLATIEKALGDLEVILEAATCNPARRISELRTN